MPERLGVPPVRSGLDPAVAKGRRALRSVLTDIDPGERVAVALSGGADSLALTACLAFVGAKAGWDCHAVVVDHGLQPESGDVAQRAATQARTLGLSADVVPVAVDKVGGVESAARRARYAALDAQEAAVILLGHTMDDQAETVLLGLGRGSGPRSIAGMPVVTHRFRRPFLGLRRAETERICAVSGVEPWADPHNADPRFRRSRIRHEVVPLLEGVLGGGVVEALSRTAAQVRQDTEFLDVLAAEAISGDLGVAELGDLPAALRSRVLRSAALSAGASASDLTAGHLDELDRLITDWRGQDRVELPGGVSAVREGEALHFIATPVEC